MNSDKGYGGTSIKVYIKNERLIKDLYYIHYIFSLIWWIVNDDYFLMVVDMGKKIVD